MAKLSNEQIETAMHIASREGCMPSDLLRSALWSVAPYLQMMWDEPTPGEQTAFQRDYDSVAAHHSVRTLSAMKQFVRRRNTALMCEPADPRKEKIVRVLTKAHGHNIADPEAIAGFILNALDEEVRLSQDMYQNSTLYRDTATMPSPRPPFDRMPVEWKETR